MRGIAGRAIAPLPRDGTPRARDLGTRVGALRAAVTPRPHSARPHQSSEPGGIRPLAADDLRLCTAPSLVTASLDESQVDLGQALGLTERLRLSISTTRPRALSSTQ